MALDHALAAVVTPSDIHMYNIGENDDGSMWAKHIRSIPLRHSVGFAHGRFVRDSSGAGTVKQFSACIAGHNGLVVYNVPTDDTRIHGDFYSISTIWSSALDQAGGGLASRRTTNDLTIQPLLGENGKTLSWLIMNGDDSPFRFATTS